jgi:hypothetical protein
VKLRKQAPAKALIVAAITGLLFGFLGLIKSDPRIAAQPQPSGPAPDFERFFVPQGQAQQPPPAVVTPHTRTRAS